MDVDFAVLQNIYGSQLHSLPFTGFSPVRQQLLNILRTINRKRKRSDFELVPVSALRLGRRSVKVFMENEELERASKQGHCDTEAGPPIIMKGNAPP